MNREQIEKIIENVIDLYNQSNPELSIYSSVDLVTIANMFDFKVFEVSLKDRGILAALMYKVENDENNIDGNYILIDDSLSLEEFNEVLSDTLYNHILGLTLNGEDEPQMIITEEGELHNFELAVPRKELLKKYVEYSKNTNDPNEVLERLAYEFCVSEDAIVQRYRNLEMDVPYTEEEAYSILKKTFEKITKPQYS